MTAVTLMAGAASSMSAAVGGQGSPMTSMAAGAGAMTSTTAGASGGAAVIVPIQANCSPASEQCDNRDNDCDGKVDEEVARACGPDAVGQCKPGMEVCQAGVWSGNCLGAVRPVAEVCDSDQLDENCDGVSNEGCVCTSGASRTCPKVAGVCQPGTQTCQNGTWSAACAGEQRGTTETCDGTDEDCDGTPDNGAVCPGTGARCASGRCVTCTLATQLLDCPPTNNPCQANACDGQKCSASNVPDGMLCQTAAIRVGYCSAGQCQPDSEVVCSVGGSMASQWLFMPGTYKTCEPNNCQNTSGFDSFGPCETKRSHQPVVWTLFDMGRANPTAPVDRVYVKGKDTVCPSAGATGSSCRIWFADPRVKSNDVPVQCSIFDDGAALLVGPERQFVPSINGEGHPAPHDGATVCTPTQCRHWIGACSVMQ